MTPTPARPTCSVSAIPHLRSPAAAPRAGGRNHPTKLATLRIPGATRAVVLDGNELVDLGTTDVGAFLATSHWTERATAAIKDDAAARYDVATANFATMVPAPSKVVCVGLNYRTHIQEMGRDLPDHPTLFSKFAETLIGAGDSIVRPPESKEFDWEVELAVVIGAHVRRADPRHAAGAIAGFTVFNDITCQDWQFRTREWLQGKNWKAARRSAPTSSPPTNCVAALGVRLSVDGEVMQADTTADLLFDPVALVHTSPPLSGSTRRHHRNRDARGGVGHARDPKRYLIGGETVVAEIEGIVRLENTVVKEEVN